jgi:hypothetical protein
MVKSVVKPFYLKVMRWGSRKALLVINIELDVASLFCCHVSKCISRLTGLGKSTRGYGGSRVNLIESSASDQQKTEPGLGDEFLKEKNGRYLRISSDRERLTPSPFQAKILDLYFIPGRNIKLLTHKTSIVQMRSFHATWLK